MYVVRLLLTNKFLLCDWRALIPKPSRLALLEKRAERSELLSVWKRPDEKYNELKL